ncbi:MAG TPA: glycosyltransferase family 2 protein [Rhizomicrobium sp.]|nr:glycosyltransferase family 2 protein [Rhizomicrobium sp.]
MSASAPHFSVIVPVHNQAVALGGALRSVLAQSCQDFEIIVVDDGSSDDPARIVAGFDDPRIRFLRQSHQGGGAARNAGIDAARGRFIAPLEAGDVFLPHHLESMQTLLEGTRNTVGYARIVVDRGQGRTSLRPSRALRKDENMGEYLLCEGGFVPITTLVVDRLLARRVRYNTQLRAAEGTDFAFRLWLAGCKFLMAGKPGAVWNQTSDLHQPSSPGPSLRTQRFGLWLEQMKPHMTRRAWVGGRGWALAKMVARDGNRQEALKLCLDAFLRGCYGPRLAPVVFLQVCLDAARYRKLADMTTAWLHFGPRERVEKAAPLASLKNA